MNYISHNDTNRQENLFDTPNFLSKTFDSQDYPRIATTRRLTSMNEPKHSGFGIIQLSLITSDNHLTLKSKSIEIRKFDNKLVYLVLQVKGIHSYLSNILVKMTLIPDQKPLECHTRVVPNRNGTGIFNEKFTFEINNDDFNKRLCFSVYNYEPEKNQLNFQGCLSFGIRNTIKKQKV